MTRSSRSSTKQNRRRLRPLIFIALALTVVASACSTADDSVSSPANGSDGDASSVDVNDWSSVLRAARGTTVRWYLYGGSDAINRFVDETYTDVLKEEYDITLERVGVADTSDAVNQVLAENEAGKDPGAVDLIWINGENFASLKKAGLLRTDWGGALPNSAFVNWDDPSLNLDFGEPVDFQESPWSSAQFQFIYDTERTEEADLPRSYGDLKAWACDHPGRSTYIAPGPGAFQGTRFVKSVLFEISGGSEQWATFDQDLWDEWSPKLWDSLNELAPCLWREGTTYPADENELHGLFANDEVDFSVTQAIVGPASLIAEGLVPTTSKAFVWDDNSIGDFNYVAIPKNAPQPAAALILANLLLEPASQAKQIDPELGFGLGFGIDISKVSDEDDLALLTDAAGGRGDAAADIEDLDASRVSDGAAEYQDLIETEWRTQVIGGA